MIGAPVSLGSPASRTGFSLLPPGDPVFIVGMNGSGTTMLLDCLGRHSSLYGFPRETRVIPHLMSIAPRYAPLTDSDNFERLWRYTARLAQFRMANGGLPMPLPDASSRASCTPDLAGLLDMLMQCFAQRSGKYRWCEKSPNYAQHMLKLDTLFPTARFIHVIRDGRDCASSFHRRWQRSPELAITRWKQLLRIARVQGETLGARYMEVRYEDLTAAPDAWLRQICEFVDLPFEVAVLQSSQPYLRADSGAAPGLRPNSGGWQQHFSAHRSQRLEQIAGRQLAELGYATTLAEGDETPPAWRQTCWRGADAVRQQLREVNLKLRGRIARPWWSILSRPINAWRQGKENQY